MVIVSFAFLSAAVFHPAGARGQQLNALPDFTAEDRVLVFAPHPDDEVLGAGGVIQQALNAGSEVTVAYLTCGDHNEFAFIAYEKRITFRRSEFIHMGEIRRKESLAAVQSLGVPQERLIFLGYPDFGTMEIFTKYWGTSKPFRYLLTRISKVPYMSCISPDAPYIGESILQDIVSILQSVRPTKIFVTHPLDVNRDHRAMYLFVQVAAWETEGTLPPPQIFYYLIHLPGWPLPRGYHPQLMLQPSIHVKDEPMIWFNAVLNEAEVNKKMRALRFYKSQMSTGYLLTFARKNELFSRYPVIVLRRLLASEKPQWQEADSSMEAPTSNQSVLPKVSYAADGKDLLIRLVPHKRKYFMGSTFLAGYRKDVSFAMMPKISLKITSRSVAVMDKKKRIRTHGISLQRQNTATTVRVPLSLLGNPSKILACVRAPSAYLSFEDSAWRVLQIE